MSSNIETYIAEKRDYFNQSLLKNFPEDKKSNSKLSEAIRYSLFAEGKRLRPVLCLIACETFNNDCKKALPIACALEMIHTYSLIHDDLPSMDDDSLRRGIPTNHSVYGEALAILAGDSLLTDAFNLIVDKGLLAGIDPDILLEIIKRISCAAGSEGMILGQTFDINFEGNSNISTDEINMMHSLKTGKLIEASIISGALIGGAVDSDLNKLSLYSQFIGLAYQVVDDILDQQGGDKIGKNLDSDKKKDKQTYLSILGVDKSKRVVSELTEKAISSLEGVDGNISRLIEVAEYLGKRKH